MGRVAEEGGPVPVVGGQRCGRGPDVVAQDGAGFGGREDAAVPERAALRTGFEELLRGLLGR
ncbi:hypothetical protein ACFZCY_38000 [Streptomyces sp. NPDC007983]|uniref:hypothetical protein n=1 Tax=Streptomyces sp. NPDC007983 TaxID=3364800 RepID=UPI0036EE3CC7